jgi:hypothetical protein
VGLLPGPQPFQAAGHSGRSAGAHNIIIKFSSALKQCAHQHQALISRETVGTARVQWQYMQWGFDQEFFGTRISESEGGRGLGYQQTGDLALPAVPAASYCLLYIDQRHNSNRNLMYV